MKTRERKTRDFTDIRCVKGEDQKVLIDRKDLKMRWKEYFRILLNEKFPRENQDENGWNKGLVDKINDVKFLSVVNRIKNKAVEPDGLLVEVLKVLGGNRVE